MKKIILSLVIAFAAQLMQAQVSFYKGEWRCVNKTELFTCVCRIEIKDNAVVSGELVWTYLACDSSSPEMTDMYKGKKGKTAIEFIEGTFDPDKGDVYFEGMKKKDPDLIIGMDKYSLKFSIGRKALFGKTDSNGQNDGLFYAVKVEPAAGLKEFNTLKRKVK